MTTGMQVESSRTLRLLAHELRGSLAVIQGYVRLLRPARAENEAEARMLTGILDATTRISAIARQASELSTWMDGRALDGHDAIRIAALVERALAGASSPSASSDVAEDAAKEIVQTPNASSLAAALSAIVDAVGRGLAPDQPVKLRARLADRHRVTIEIVPEAADAAAGHEPIAFDQGGHGLALVLAAAVLDAHDAAVSSLPGGTVVVTLLGGQ
jgi:signal transduction histidine kinase